jgi:alcohol dehydrogenase class IV
MLYNVDHAADKLILVAQALGVDTAGMSPRDAGLAAADTVEALMKEIGHPRRLRDVGVPEENLPVCSFNALAYTANIFNARPVNDQTGILNL